MKECQKRTDREPIALEEWQKRTNILLGARRGQFQSCCWSCEKRPRNGKCQCNRQNPGPKRVTLAFCCIDRQQKLTDREPRALEECQKRTDREPIAREEPKGGSSSRVVGHVRNDQETVSANATSNKVHDPSANLKSNNNLRTRLFTNKAPWQHTLQMNKAT